MPIASHEAERPFSTENPGTGNGLGELAAPLEHLAGLWRPDVAPRVDVFSRLSRRCRRAAPKYDSGVRSKEVEFKDEIKHGKHNTAVPDFSGTSFTSLGQDIQ